MSRAAWLLLAVATISALVSLGFSIAGLALLDAAAPTSPYVLYALSRAVAIVVACVVIAVIRSAAAVVVMGTLMALVQALDAVVGAVTGDPTKTFGPLALAAITVVAIVAHARSARGAPAAA